MLAPTVEQVSLGKQRGVIDSGHLFQSAAYPNMEQAVCYALNDFGRRSYVKIDIDSPASGLEIFDSFRNMSVFIKNNVIGGYDFKFADQLTGIRFDFGIKFIKMSE